MHSGSSAQSATPQEKNGVINYVVAEHEVKRGEKNGSFSILRARLIIPADPVDEEGIGDGNPIGAAIQNPAPNQPHNDSLQGRDRRKPIACGELRRKNRRGPGYRQNR